MDRKSFEELCENGTLEDIPESQEEIMNESADEHMEAPVETEQQSAYPKLDTVSATDLQNTDFPPLRFIIEDLLAAGLNILASPPKYGKSWMMMDLCIAVASGEKFLGFPTNRCECLYLSLEDSLRRLKNRLEKLLGEKSAPQGMHLGTAASCIDNGLLDELAS